MKLSERMCEGEYTKAFEYAPEVAELEAENERLYKALREEYIITPNDHFCKSCGTDWALASPHEHHEERCALHGRSKYE